MKAFLTLLFVLWAIYWFIYIIEKAEKSACIYKYNQIQKLVDTDFYQDELLQYNKICK